MSREEAIKDLEVIKDFFAENSGAIPLSIEYAIKALEQELVLDKIKTEIEKRADDYFSSGSYDEDLYNGAYKDALYWCFDLIDKYKGESEE